MSAFHSTCWTNAASGTQVDLNVLPSILVDRIDVLTGTADAWIRASEIVPAFTASTFAGTTYR